jgi:hypothetical protein
MISGITARKMMDALNDARQYVLFDPSVTKKVNQYVLANPADWERW